MALVMDIARLKIIKYKFHIKNRHNGNFMYRSFACSCVEKNRNPKLRPGSLKGLSHEIDFKTFEKNLQNLA